MGRRILLVILTIVLPICASAQVDTLRLMIDNDISAYDEITGYYLRDINNDSNLEVIICLPNFVFVYNSQTSEILWLSNAIYNPEDLRFADFNHDSFPDIAVKQDSIISVYDIHNDNIIWVSPALDSTFECYALGDIDNDGFTDIIIAGQPMFESYHYPEARDTADFDIYYGPDYSTVRSFQVLTSNYYYEGFNGLVLEDISSINIVPLWDGMDTVTSIYVFSQVRDEEHSMPTHFLAISGNSWIINPHSFEQNKIDSTGSLLEAKTYDIYGHDEFVTLSSTVYNFHYYDPGDTFAMAWYVNSYSSDGLVELSVLWQHPDYQTSCGFKGYAIGDMNYAQPGKEICIAAKDSLYQFSYPDRTSRWTRTGYSNLANIFASFKSSDLFNFHGVMAYALPDSAYCYLYDGDDGNLTVVLANEPGRELGVADFDGDGSDELFSIDYNHFIIYHLDNAVDIDQPLALPHSTFLQPNYPNPFNPTTTIEYGLASNQQVTIGIYDLLGRKVETLVDDYEPAGLYELTWNAGALPSGIYFYRITTDGYSKTREMMILK